MLAGELAGAAVIPEAPGGGAETVFAVEITGGGGRAGGCGLLD